jgi:hypothetical protein
MFLPATAMFIMYLVLTCWCRVTFQPAINRRKVERLDMDGDNTQEETVFDRLLQYASKLTEKKKLQEQLARRPIDPNTGRMFFRPHTGRKPQSDVSSSSHPSGKAAYVLSSRSGDYFVVQSSGTSNRVT